MNGETANPPATRNDSGASEQQAFVAWLYYVQGFKQQRIAERLGISRPTVVRLLQRARASGIVDIQIRAEIPATTALATRIEIAFSSTKLRRVIVAPGDGMSACGRAAGLYLTESLSTHDIVGVGWSRTVAHVEIGQPVRGAPRRVLQLAGSIDSSPSSSINIVARLAHAWGANLRALPVPLIVRDPATARALRSERVVAAAIDSFKSCTVAIVGIGVVGAESTIVATGYATSDEMQSLMRAGAVCDILGTYLNERGKTITDRWANRRLAMSLEQLAKVPNVVAICAGAAKNVAVRAALLSDLVATLVVDTELAEALLSPP